MMSEFDEDNNPPTHEGVRILGAHEVRAAGTARPAPDERASDTRASNDPSFDEVSPDAIARIAVSESGAGNFMGRADYGKLFRPPASAM